MFCSLALSGHVVKPTALDAIPSSPRSLSFLIAETKAAIAASAGSEMRFYR